VTILGEWLRSSDFPLSLLAAKTLANMDIDNDMQQAAMFSDSVFIYHPKYYSRRYVLDCLFIIQRTTLVGMHSNRFR